MLTTVCYDVSDDRQRAALARVLEGYGNRVQGSVFECHLSSRERDHLVRDLRSVLDAGPGPATVRLYGLCAACEGRTQEIGEGPPFGDVAYFMV